MTNFETSAMVGDQGRVLIAGVPFAPGSEVDVKISLKNRSGGEATPQDDASLDAARERMRELFRTIKGFHNTPRIPREELYDRGSLR